MEKLTIFSALNYGDLPVLVSARHCVTLRLRPIGSQTTKLKSSSRLGAWSLDSVPGAFPAFGTADLRDVLPRSSHPGRPHLNSRLWQSPPTATSISKNGNGKEEVPVNNISRREKDLRSLSIRSKREPPDLHKPPTHIARTFWPASMFPQQNKTAGKMETFESVPHACSLVVSLLTLTVNRRYYLGRAFENH